MKPSSSTFRPLRLHRIYSRQIFLRFFLDARLENFLRGHADAFHAWNGLPRVLLYDNLKSAVLERQGDAIRFHRTLLDFARHAADPTEPLYAYTHTPKEGAMPPLRFQGEWCRITEQRPVAVGNITCAKTCRAAGRQNWSPRALRQR